MYPSPLYRAWKEKLLEAANHLFEIPSTKHKLLVLSQKVRWLADDNDATKHPSPNKRTRIKDKIELEKDEHHQSSSSTNPALYWPESTEARQVFQPTSSAGKGASSRRKRGSSSAAPVGDNAPYYETTKKALQRRLRLLQSADESEDGWRNVILGRDVNN